MASPSSSEFITVQEAADILHLTPETLRRRIRAGKLRAHRAGDRKLLIHRSDINPAEAYPTRVATSEDIAEFVAKAVAEAPPLSADQRARIAALLNGGAA